MIRSRLRGFRRSGNEIAVRFLSSPRLLTPKRRQSVDPLVPASTRPLRKKPGPATVGELLDQLHQDDFELLIELIFSSSGWKRISAVGGTQKMLDLAMILPTTGEYCFVQVKSQTSKPKLLELVEALANATGYSRMFFAYHTPAEAFQNVAADRVTVWNRQEIARQTVRAGLVDWLLQRTT